MESRIESILTNMINDETETIRPQSRIEVLLSQLAEKIENIDQSLTRYRGRVDSVADLPAAGEKAGDWYFVGLVTDTTMSEYAWNGTSWDPIGSSEITVSGLVSYAESQSLQDSEKLTARNNIGLGNVDNTADADKPISTATQTALNGKADAATTYTKTEVDTALSAKADEDTAIQGIKVNSTTVNPDANKVVNITVPTSAADVSALPDTTKYAAALGLTINSSTFVMTGQLKDQNGDNLGTAQTIDLPLESVVVGGSYNSQTKKVVLTLQNGNTIEFSVADLVSGLQTELSASNKLNPAYIDYDSAHAAVSDTEKAAWNSKQSALTAEQLAAVNSGVTEDNVEQIETNKNNILSLDAEVDTVANLGVKNLLDLSNVVPTVPSGLTCTNNGDGTYTVSGTLSSANSIKFAILAIEGELILNGCPSGGGDSSYMQRITKNGTAVANTTDTGSGSNSFTMSGTSYELNFRFAAGTYTNVMFKPMLRPASISDSTYQPYALSNATLTPALQECVDNGAKNLFQVTGTATTGSGITLTWNYSEGYVIVNGTSAPSGAPAIYLTLGSWTASKDGYYVIASVNANSSDVLIYNDQTWATWETQTWNPVRYFTKGTTMTIFLRITAGTVCNNLKVYPMICTKASWDISHAYRPYCPSYQELYDMVKALQTQINNQ